MVNTPDKFFFRTWFHKQCDYLLKFQAGKKKESILQQKWPRNNSIVEDNAYKSHAFAYIKEMD